MTHRMEDFLNERGALSQLARDTGINVSMLSDIRTGARRPCKTTARRIATALQQEVTTVFPDFSELAGREVRQ